MIVNNRARNVDEVFEKGSIDDMVLDSTLEEQRANFKFPKDFSFDDPEFEKEVVKLYGRHNFDWEILGRKEKKRVRNSYQNKCKEWFIEYYNWPPGLAAITSRMVGLPNHTTHKKVPKKSLEIGINIIAGSLPEKYAAPIAKLMNEPRYILTKHSIYFDAAEILFVGAVAASFWAGNKSPEWIKDVHDWAEGGYSWTGLEKETLKWWMTGATAFRTAEVIVRTIAYKIDKIHTPSPAMLFPINPAISRGGIMTAVFLYDISGRIKDAYKKTKDAYISYTSPKLIELDTAQNTQNEINTAQKIENIKYNNNNKHNNVAVEYVKLPSTETKPKEIRFSDLLNI